MTDLSGALVEFGGLSISGTKPVSGAWVTDISGWESLPPSRVDGGQGRPNSHSGFGARVFAGPRQVIVTGDAYSAAARDALLAEMQGALSYSVDASATQELAVTLAGRRLTADAQITGFEPEIGPAWAVGMFPWAVQWLCTDPYRYGAAVSASTGLPVVSGGLEYDLYTNGSGLSVDYLDYGAAGTSGTVVVSNNGTAEARPVLTVTGSLPAGFEVVERFTGSRLTYVGPVTVPGDAVTLDSGTGRARLGSADRGGVLTRSEWWGIPPGATREVQFASLGAYSADAVLTVSFRPTFW